MRQLPAPGSVVFPHVALVRPLFPPAPDFRFGQAKRSPGLLRCGWLFDP
jgi:hypothetical protein